MTTSAPGKCAGTSAFDFGVTRGRIRAFRAPDDVIDVFGDELDDVIALVESGGTTFLSPILGRLGGIVCTSGTTRSHLAIVSREYGVPCLLAVDLDGWEPADGTHVLLESSASGDGWLSLSTDASEAAPAEQTPPPPAHRSAGTGPVRRFTSATTGSAVEDWWNYLGTVGDDIGCKPFPSSVGADTVAELCAQRMSDEQLEALVLHMGRSFKPEMTRRSGFTSEIFPMMPYMSMSVIEDFHSYPARIRAIDAAVPAEVLGARLRENAGLVSPLWIWMVGYHYLCGRELLIHMGKLAPSDDLDDVRTVVDFWRRLTLAHRGDGTLDYKDAGFTNRYLPEAVVAQLRGTCRELDAATSKQLRQLNAALSGYCFMYFTDSRVGICDNGPYPAGDGQATLVRDFLSLDTGPFEYPWARESDPGVAGVTLTLTYPVDAFEDFEINDWGTTFTEPEQFLAAVTSASVTARYADGTSAVLPPEQWSELADRLGAEHLKLYRRFSEMDRAERILAATRMYSWGLRPFARLAGVADTVDWSFSDRTMALFPEPLGDDDQAAAIFGGALVAHSRPSAFTGLR
ncbi:PEP-utilizing enzyme [Nocardia higoensis]|uniref:PEP-utilizing enzyme n=1 Tax=Nocardia higoensis TaxID=228599 RepID=UPI0002FA9B9E|nr:PEP-utilizing enzyme [Nocardia higoensis]